MKHSPFIVRPEHDGMEERQVRPEENSVNEEPGGVTMASGEARDAWYNLTGRCASFALLNPPARICKVPFGGSYPL